jgi:hypothetical protein
MSVSSYLASSSVLTQSFLSMSLGSTGISLFVAPFFSSATDYSTSGWFDVEAINVPFFTAGG